MKLILLALLLPILVVEASEPCIYSERRQLVNCRGGHLNHIPFDFLKDKNFTTLDLGVNNITSVNDTALFQLASRDRIETLYLDHNEISFLPHHAFKAFPGLRLLDLSNNKLKNIDRRFCDMTELTELILNENAIERIWKKAFVCLRKLKFLSLRNCNLTSDPNVIVPIDLQIDFGNNITNYDPSTQQSGASFPAIEVSSEKESPTGKNEDEYGKSIVVGSVVVIFIVLVFTVTSIVIVLKIKK